MAPVKFGLFKARSRDHQEQPSTENLLQSTNSFDRVATLGSPVPSTSKGLLERPGSANVSVLSFDSDEDIASLSLAQSRRVSECSTLGEAGGNYHQLMTPSSTVATSTSTLQDIDLDQTRICEDLAVEDSDGASTSCDVNSIQIDNTSIALSEDVSVRCMAMKKEKKNRMRKQQLLSDHDMWTASNYKVMQKLLSRSCTLDEQLKWEAIATTRGLCTLTDNCVCKDCRADKYLAGMTDGDAGMGAAPLFSAINFGCQIQ